MHLTKFGQRFLEKEVFRLVFVHVRCFSLQQNILHNIIKTSSLKPRYCSGVQYVLRWRAQRFKHGDNTNTCRCVLASLSPQRRKVPAAVSSGGKWHAPPLEIILEKPSASLALPCMDEVTPFCLSGQLVWFVSRPFAWRERTTNLHLSALKREMKKHLIKNTAGQRRKWKNGNS